MILSLVHREYHRLVNSTSTSFCFRCHSAGPEVLSFFIGGSLQKRSALNQPASTKTTQISASSEATALRTRKVWALGFWERPKSSSLRRVARVRLNSRKLRCRMPTRSLNCGVSELQLLLGSCNQLANPLVNPGPIQVYDCWNVHNTCATINCF